MDNIIHSVDNGPFVTMCSYKISTIQGEQTSGKCVPACTCGPGYHSSYTSDRSQVSSRDGPKSCFHPTPSPPPISLTLCVLPVVPTIPEVSFGSQIERFRTEYSGLPLSGEGGPLISVHRPKFAFLFFTNRAGIALLLFTFVENSEKE